MVAHLHQDAWMLADFYELAADLEDLKLLVVRTRELVLPLNAGECAS